MNTFFSDKIILWRKMAKIWLKIWLKVKENGTKKIKLAKMVAKEKEILVRTLSTLMGHFVLSPREREKRDRRDSRGDEREGQGRKRKMNESDKTEEI